MCVNVIFTIQAIGYVAYSIDFIYTTTDLAILEWNLIVMTHLGVWSKVACLSWLE